MKRNHQGNLARNKANGESRLLMVFLKIEGTEAGNHPIIEHTGPVFRTLLVSCAFLCLPHIWKSSILQASIDQMFLTRKMYWKYIYSSFGFSFFWSYVRFISDLEYLGKKVFCTWTVINIFSKPHSCATLYSCRAPTVKVAAHWVQVAAGILHMQDRIST